MIKNRIITAGAVALACAFILTSQTTSGQASAERPIRQEQGGIAGSGACVPGWHPLTSGGQTGCNFPVSALTVWNGDLIAGGEFITAGGQTVNHIARWDGVSGGWHPFTAGGQIGVNGAVFALTVWNGDLIAGGYFTTAGGQTVNHIARWDGSAWHPFTSGGQIGVSGEVVGALTVWNGDLIAGGFFGTAGGQTVNLIARWDGSAWHPFTSGGQVGVSDEVRALTVWNGDLVAGGYFNMAGGQTVNRIARWDGSGWHPFTSGGQTGVAGGSARALTVWDGNLIAGGEFISAGGQEVRYIARWDGSAWHPFTSGGQIGMNNPVEALTVWNGFPVAGGSFFTAGGQTINYIARWDGSAWHPLIVGCDLVGVSANVRSLIVYDGDLIAGGNFTSAGGQTVNFIARWVGCPPVGACCINGVALGVTITEVQCLAVGGFYQGDDTLPGEVTCPAPEPMCVGDLNNSGTVDVQDLLILLGAWGPCPK